MSSHVYDPNLSNCNTSPSCELCESKPVYNVVITRRLVKCNNRLVLILLEEQLEPGGNPGEFLSAGKEKDSKLSAWVKSRQDMVLHVNSF